MQNFDDLPYWFNDKDQDEDCEEFDRVLLAFVDEQIDRTKDQDADE